MKQILAFLTCCLLWPALGYAQSDTVTLDTKTGTLSGTLLRPTDKAGPYPLVILHAGSGPTDRDGNQGMFQAGSLRLLADGLAKRGIASLRYDKRGVGSSASAGLDEKDLRFEDFVDDLKAWIAAYRTDDRFSAITLAGHSEGALISMLAARDEPGVDAFISLAGPGRPADALLHEQLVKQFPDQDATLNNLLDSIRQGEIIQDLPPNMQPIFRTSVQPYLHSWFQYDPRQVIAELAQPILIVQGTTDIQVPENAADLLSKAAGNNVQKIIYPHMNHLLKTCPYTERNLQILNYMNPNLPLHEGLVDDLATFIQAIKH